MVKRKKAHDWIPLTPGATPKIPLFQGELMECAVCGKQKQSDPTIESNWTAFDLDSLLVYICPECFPRYTDNQEVFAREVYELLLNVLGDLNHGKK